MQISILSKIQKENNNDNNNNNNDNNNNSNNNKENVFTFFIFHLLCSSFSFSIVSLCCKACLDTHIEN